MSIPPVIRSYLATEDGMARAQLGSDHPELERQLADPATRRAVLDWLRTDQAQRPEFAELVMGCIGFLRAAAEPDETPVVRPFTLHPAPEVRLRAFEFLLTLYFPERNRDALLLVLQSMLADADDAVRTQGARFVERAGAGAELGLFLAHWSQQAADRDWDTGEAAELVERLRSEDGEG